MSELLFAPSIPTTSILHLENPIRQPWSQILSIFASRLGLADDTQIPFPEWLDLVNKHGQPVDNPCVKIASFLEQEFLRMATGQVVLDTTVAKRVSSTLAGSKAVPEDVLVKYVEYWKSEKFI
jgi:hypothetical protein